MIESHELERKLAARLQTMFKGDLIMEAALPLLGFFTLAVNYGWRAGELLGLKCEQVDLFGKGAIHLYDSKNGSPRSVPLIPETRPIVTQLMLGKSKDAYLLSATGKRLVGNSFRRKWNEAAVDVGLGRYTHGSCAGKIGAGHVCPECLRKIALDHLHYHGLIPHDMRRTAARNMRRSGASPTEIKAIGRWKTDR